MNLNTLAAVPEVYDALGPLWVKWPFSGRMTLPPAAQQNRSLIASAKTTSKNTASSPALGGRLSRAACSSSPALDFRKYWEDERVEPVGQVHDAPGRAASTGPTIMSKPTVHSKPVLLKARI